MNLILHNKGTGEIKSGNTLSNPKFTESGNLQLFDFLTVNPPFSDKEWSDGVDTDRDQYDRFTGFDTPPAKNGDYAWLLHVLRCLKPRTGRAAIILPHGVLFRGNAEARIRNRILEKKWLTGIVSLPANLFYGTGIPACILILDKAETTGVGRVGWAGFWGCARLASI